MSNCDACIDEDDIFGFGLGFGFDFDENSVTASFAFQDLTNGIVSDSEDTEGEDNYHMTSYNYRI
jgi:hypothetical protein